MSRASENMECTENDSTDTVNIAAEKPPSDPVADVVVADLSFSPPSTSTQLNAVTTAKHGGKTKGRGKNTPGISGSRNVNIKGNTLMILSGTAESGTETNDWLCFLTSY